MKREDNIMTELYNPVCDEKIVDPMKNAKPSVHPSITQMSSELFERLKRIRCDINEIANTLALKEREEQAKLHIEDLKICDLQTNTLASLNVTDAIFSDLEYIKSIL